MRSRRYAPAASLETPRLGASSGHIHFRGIDMPPKQSARRQTTISFYGQDIVAYQELDPNETYVPIVRLCARLGLERAAQERRVRGHAVLASGAHTMPVEFDDGHTAPALCLRVDLLPLWLN